MKRFLAVALCMFFLAGACFGAAVPAVASEAATEKQPVFLMCPHKERYSAWSLSFVVDKKDPSKPLSLILEELSQKNSKDEGGYAKVLAAQADPATPRVQVATLDAKSFGSGALRVTENNALSVTCTPDGENYKLSIDMRVSADGHFIMGGQEASRRDIVLKFDKTAKKWKAYATALTDKNGRNVVGADPVQITGIAFPVTGTGIYRVAASLASGAGVIIYDK